MTQIIATFYKFVKLLDCQQKKEPLLKFCQNQTIKGTIILAEEGINGAIAGTRQEINAVIGYLGSDSRFADLEFQESLTEHPPFERLKVRLKREIVTLGLPEITLTQQVGTYVNPQDWNDLIQNPEVLVLDTRNIYEVDLGTFQGAINPQTDCFREFPDYVRQNLNSTKHKKIAMFCTGGIRCEKASSYLLNQGFEQVYQLKGGVLSYLKNINPENSLWQGECFVFDERVAVTNSLKRQYY